MATFWTNHAAITKNIYQYKFILFVFSDKMHFIYCTKKSFKYHLVSTYIHSLFLRDLTFISFESFVSTSVMSVDGGEE